MPALLIVTLPGGATECPSGSAGAALEIIASWENSNFGFVLHVIEPGGVEVADAYNKTKLGVSTPMFGLLLATRTCVGRQT